jgi:hypothetical protein
MGVTRSCSGLSGRPLLVLLALLVTVLLVLLLLTMSHSASEG